MHKSIYIAVDKPQNSSHVGIKSHYIPKTRTVPESPPTPFFPDLPLKTLHCVHIMKAHKLTFTSAAVQEFGLKAEAFFCKLSLAVKEMVPVFCLTVEKVSQWKLKIWALL